MNYFTYNGVNSFDMGLRIQSKNVFSAPKRDLNFQSVSGRNGDLIVSNNRYENVDISYTVFVAAKNNNEILYQSTMSVARNMLKSSLISKEEYNVIDTIFLEPTYTENRTYGGVRGAKSLRLASTRLLFSRESLSVKKYN